MKNIDGFQVIGFFILISLFIIGIIAMTQLKPYYFWNTLVILGFCIGIFISHKFGKLCEELGGKYWIGFLGGPISTIYYIGKKFKEK